MVETLSYQPVTDGFSIQWGNDTRVFTPEFGKSRSRRVGIGNPDMMTMQWVLNPTEYSAFSTFYYTTLNGGVDQFYLTLNTVVRTCRFVSGLQTSQVAGFTHYVTAQVEVLR